MLLFFLSMCVCEKEQEEPYVMNKAKNGLGSKPPPAQSNKRKTQKLLFLSFDQVFATHISNSVVVVVYCVNVCVCVYPLAGF